MSILSDSLEKVRSGQNLPRAEIRALFELIMTGQAAAEPESSQLAQFLTALHHKGETAEEIAGAAEAMRSHMTRLPTSRTVVVDTCGTGGTGSKIFNVSTAAAIVTAAAGVAVAKHGNRSVTSVSGSSDVLTALGVNVVAAPTVVAACLEEFGLCFCFAQLFHPAMRHVKEVRARLGTQTIFNLLGPLCNPAGAKYQVMGVARPELRPKMASALQQLDPARAIIVGGAAGQEACGELTIAGATEVIELSATSQQAATWSPADFGLATASTETMLIDSAAASAALIRRIFAGEQGPPRDMVVLNAAAAIWVATPGISHPESAARAQEAIDSGRAGELLTRWAARTHTAA
ncbi:anthranilate phosphoribosyltransferase [Anatilimnocola floriformis]|uniref:anthranilate phosphoribosyltransferase n=1 Tax=Anatilimnocola floriformis TaxID=2948575 RepID=UPI0020C4CC4F|nr:anthranilate phosphoribosyltransferase [Anatilimnocola floriformis]